MLREARAKAEAKAAARKAAKPKKQAKQKFVMEVVFVPDGETGPLTKKEAREAIQGVLDECGYPARVRKVDLD
jgi:hypothetical protein